MRGLEGINTVAYHTSPQSAIDDTNPDSLRLLISDLYIPGFEMLTWFHRFRQTFKNATLIVISSSISRTDRTECLNAGAHLYFEKHVSPEIMVENLEKILKNKPVEDDFLGRTAQDARDVGLTDKQIDILVHLSRGLAVKEIARRFEISPETVKSHLSRIYDIIDVSSRSAASDWAKHHGLL